MNSSPWTDDFHGSILFTRDVQGKLKFHFEIWERLTAEKNLSKHLLGVVISNDAF